MVHPIISELNRQIQDANPVTHNEIIRSLLKPLGKIAVAAARDAYVQSMLDQLLALVRNHDVVVDPALLEDLVQRFGELDAYWTFKSKGVSIEKIKESNTKVPDFRIVDGQREAFVEVKTLSLVDGKRGIIDQLVSSLNAQVELQQKIASGNRVATAVSTHAPYGQKGYGTSGQSLGCLATARVLIDKARQNIKEGQFAGGDTILFLNLVMLPPAKASLSALRPSSPEGGPVDGEYCVSGDLWMVGFGRPGYLVQGIPEFEGKPAVLGHLERDGLLHEHEWIRAILFHIYPLGSGDPLGSADFVADLVRQKDFDHQSDALWFSSVMTVATDKSGDSVKYRLNDEVDSYGYGLR